MLPNIRKLATFIIYTLLPVSLYRPIAESRPKTKSIKFISTDVDFNEKYLEKHTLDINPNGLSLNIILNVRRDFPEDPWVELHVGWRQKKQANASLPKPVTSTRTATASSPKGKTTRKAVFSDFLKLKASTSSIESMGSIASQTSRLEKPNEAYREIFNYDINVCNILGKTSNEKFNLMSLWLNNFWKYGTMPKTCPILKGNYTWWGLKFDKTSLPSFVIPGDYRGVIKTYFRIGNEKDPLAKLVVKFLVK